MSRRAPVLSGQQMAKLLIKDGFHEVSSSGDHFKYKHEQRGNVVIVPMHKELKRGTLGGILDQAGWTVEDIFTVTRGGKSAATLAKQREIAEAAQDIQQQSGQKHAPSSAQHARRHHSPSRGLS